MMVRKVPLRVLWVVACLELAVAAATVLPAVAAPSRDMVVPTTVSNAQGIKCTEHNDYTAYAGICQTDNSSVSYYMTSSGDYALESPDRTVAQDVAARYGATDLSVSHDSTPDFSGSGQTDVVFQEGSRGLASKQVGATFCNDKESGYAWGCDQQYIRIRGYGAYTGKSAGHEMGHAVGLLHGSSTSPRLDDCAAALGIMRGAVSCISSVSLGTLVVDNINYVYN